MSYPETLDTNANIQKLLFKKEFAQLKLDENAYKNIKLQPKQTINDIVDNDRNSKINELTLDEAILKENLLVLHSHQLFVKNLINPNTPYTRLLLKHTTGTGKTIAALSIATTFIRYYQIQHNLTEESGYSNTPLVYIIGFSKNIFQKELLRRPEFGFITKEEIMEHSRRRHLAEFGTQLDKEKFMEFESKLKKRLSKKSRGGFFKFYGYKEFFNRLFIFSENYNKHENKEDEEVEESSNLSEDQILNGLKDDTIKLNIDLITSFANSMVICDEIHNVYNSSEINNYGIALRLLLNIYDVPEIMNTLINLQQYDISNNLTGGILKLLKNSTLRVIYMSATVINNSPTEIIDLLNLLVPLSYLPNKKKLEKEDFFEDSRNLKKNALDKIKLLVQGYISFLRDDNPKYFPEKKLEGEEIQIPNELLNERVKFYKDKTIPYLKFIRCPMSDYHQKTYDNLLETNQTETLPPDGQSLMDLVLPNPGLIQETKNFGLFRTKDVKYSLSNASQEWKDKNQISFDKIPNTNNYIITGEFMLEENVKKYSTKYSTMLKLVFKNLQEDGGKIMISHENVKMSGVLFIQELLRRNNILDEYASPIDTTLCSICGNAKIDHKPNAGFLKKNPHEFIPTRFVIFHGDIDKSTLDRSLDKFKNVENANGYYYRIIVGSKIINEGIDFNAIRQVYIVSVPPNISTLLQKMGRAIRKGSHLALPPEKRNVKIYLIVSSNKNLKKLSYEEKRYFEKSQDYLVIQQLEKAFNEVAIDAVIHRNIVMPKEQIDLFKKTKEEELGTLYFEPSGIFGKKWLDIANNKDSVTIKDVDLSTFRVYHSDDEIATIIYIIKRLFIEQSTIWEFNDLFNMVKNPPFEIYVNPKLFLEENFIIALYLLTEYDNEKSKIVDTYQITNTYLDMQDKMYENIAKHDIARLFDHLDRRIVINDPIKQIEHECKILFIEGFYILFPITAVNTQDNYEFLNTDETVNKLEKTPPSYLGISSINLSGIPDIDLDNWYRFSENIEPTNIKITKYLKTSNISYNQMKFKFYSQYKDYAVEELPTSVEIYDLDFHSKLAEDCIRYAFNVMTNLNMQFSELHDFYFKMLYFYNRLDLVLFADHLSNTKLIDNYKDYITHANLKFDVYDEKIKVKDKKENKKKKEILEENHKYNPFLMSSILKTSFEKTFNIDRLNNFLGKRQVEINKKKHPKLEDMNLFKNVNIQNKNIRKVFSNMLPVGHFLNTSIEHNSILAIPKIYLPNQDPDTYFQSGKDDKIDKKSNPWVRAYEFVQYNEPVNEVENNIIIGYYEKNPTGIDIKFKLRMPVQKITMHEDSRMTERGSACNTRKKEDLIKIATDLQINIDEILNQDSSIKSICSEIKLELMYREMHERRKYKHMSEKEKKDYKRVRWFYLHFEPQMF